MTIATAPEDQVTEEECLALDAMAAAEDRGDEEAVREALKKIRMLPENLLASKEMFGADHIRRMGYNTELADKYYGPDWLDREDPIQ